jgi:hypothetical protein
MKPCVECDRLVYVGENGHDEDSVTCDPCRLKKILVFVERPICKYCNEPINSEPIRVSAKRWVEGDPKVLIKSHIMCAIDAFYRKAVCLDEDGNLSEYSKYFESSLTKVTKKEYKNAFPGTFAKYLPFYRTQPSDSELPISGLRSYRPVVEVKFKLTDFLKDQYFVLFDDEEKVKLDWRQFVSEGDLINQPVRSKEVD